MSTTQGYKTGSYRHRPGYPAAANSVATNAQYYLSSARAQICTPSVLASEPAKPSKSKQTKANFFSTSALQQYRAPKHTIVMRTTEALRLADAVRLAEQMWLEEPWEMKARFAQLAECRLVQNQEQHPVATRRAPSNATESSGRCHQLPSPSPSTFDESEMPPTPRPQTCELPSSPSIASSPLPPLRPSSYSESQSVEPNLHRTRQPEFDPFHEEPMLRHLANNWSAPLPTSSVSLSSFVPDEGSWPYNNALGLYVDPAINVATWDTAGFIRSTAPSPSPSLVRSIRRET